MTVLEALHRLVVELDEVRRPSGDVVARGVMNFGAALRGPPGRVHGGYHAFARTFSILERLEAHDGATTFPCEVDVTMQRALPLGSPVPFEATYRRSPVDASWELTSRLFDTDRLLARARSIAPDSLVDDAARLHWKSLFEESRSHEAHFRSFGIAMHDAPRALWAETWEPRRTAPESQHAALVDADGAFGPAFVCTDLDFIGAVARARETGHPHFTKRIVVRVGTSRIPADTHLVCIADRATTVPDPDSESPPVVIDGVELGTVRVEAALFDAAFERAYGSATVTLHPVDPAKFPALRGPEDPRPEP